MRTRLAALALTLPLSLPLSLATLSACSGGDPSADASGTESGESSTEPDASVDVDATAGEEIEADEFIALMVSAFDRATTANLTMEMTAGGQEIEVTGQADYTGDPVSMRMDMSGMGGAGDMTMVMVDNVVYVQLAQMSEQYVKVDLDDPGNPISGSFAGQLDPRAQAEMIEEGLTSATYVGEEEVDGEDLERYAAVVDSQAMLAGMDVDPGSAGALPAEITYDLWFDADGLHRQMVIDMGAAAGEMLIRFEDWGTDVDISAPPADQVTDLSEMGGMPGSGEA